MHACIWLLHEDCVHSLSEPQMHTLFLFTMQTSDFSQDLVMEIIFENDSVQLFRSPPINSNRRFCFFLTVAY